MLDVRPKLSRQRRPVVAERDRPRLCSGPLRVGVAIRHNESFFQQLVDAFQDLGAEAVWIEPGCPLPPLDLLVLGTRGRDLESAVRRIPPREKRDFTTVLWQCDPLPPPSWPLAQERKRRLRAAAWDLDLLPRGWGEIGDRWPGHAKLTQRLRSVATRFAAWRGDFEAACWEGMSVAQIFYVLSQWAWIRRQVAHRRIDRVLGSAAGRVQFLESRGVPTGLAPVGYCHGMGSRNPATHRDIDALFIGRTRGSRRIGFLHDLEQQLAQRGVQLTHAPRNCFGPQRTELLNRTRIVINILKFPGDLTGMRFMMAMSCGALVVTESLDAPHPYRPGEHLVEAPLGQIAATVAQYLQDEQARAELADAGWRFATQENTIEATARSILEHVHADLPVSTARV